MTIADRIYACPPPPSPQKNDEQKKANDIANDFTQWQETRPLW